MFIQYVIIFLMFVAVHFIFYFYCNKKTYPIDFTKYDNEKYKEILGSIDSFQEKIKPEYTDAGTNTDNVYLEDNINIGFINTIDTNINTNNVHLEDNINIGLLNSIDKITN